MIGYAIAWFGSPNPFFYWAAFFYFVCIVINWGFYAPQGAEKPWDAGGNTRPYLRGFP